MTAILARRHCRAIRLTGCGGQPACPSDKWAARPARLAVWDPALMLNVLLVAEGLALYRFAAIMTE
jgi:hypothetical protein